MSQVVEATVLDVDLPAEPRSASRARRAVLDALRGVAVDRDAVGIVVSEAVTNAVVHAYREREPGRVRVTVSVGRHGIAVTVEDDGGGLRPRDESPGAGLGLPLMGDLADQVEIADRDHGRGTRVRAVFHVLGPAGPHGRPLARHGAGRAQRRLTALI